MHSNGIKKKEYINMAQQQEIYVYCSMNKQYVEGEKNGKNLLDEGK